LLSQHGIFCYRYNCLIFCYHRKVSFVTDIIVLFFFISQKGIFCYRYNCFIFCYHSMVSFVTDIIHCRQRAPVGIDLSSSGRCQSGMFDIQATTKSKYYDHIVLLYLESRRCRYRSFIFACFYLYITVVIFIDYSDIDKMMDINNDKC
jgi:hypothetical protein